jgi:uncharacterized protein (DUF302 family)
LEKLSTVSVLAILGDQCEDVRDRARLDRPAPRLGDSDVNYGKSVITALSFDDAVEAAKELLRGEGFGVLCEIDVTKTLREKIGVAFRRYRILGACNPKFAFEALQTEPQLGLLLPCNVVIQELSEGTVASAVDARAMLSIVENSELLGVADEVNARLGRVLDGLRST